MQGWIESSSAKASEGHSRTLLAGPSGFEPERAVLETAMIPFHHEPIYLLGDIISWHMIVNWNTDEKLFRKNNPKEYKLWRIKQALTYGGERVKRAEIIKNWGKISEDLDIDTKKAIEFLVWGRKWKKEPGLQPDRSNYLDWLVKTKNLAISI